jgi:hypothetical protein
MPVYAGRKRPVFHHHKPANSLTRLLGHKGDTERALSEQVKTLLLFQLYSMRSTTTRNLLNLFCSISYTGQGRV